MRRRRDNVVDRWDGHIYRRVLTLLAGSVEVAVTQTKPLETPLLEASMNDTRRHSKFEM